MLKRLFDLFASIIALLVVSPVFLLIAIVISVDSKGGVLYRQERIGRNGRPFQLYKFRTMKIGSDKKGLLTVGSSDNRITHVGRILRKYKLDELPQIFNIIKNEMSIVGPRPEVEKYVRLYTEEQKKVLWVKPGLTDLASLEYINENELLAKAENPEKFYVEVVMPAKLRLNLQYIEKMSLTFDIKIILKTLRKILD